MIKASLTLNKATTTVTVAPLGALALNLIYFKQTITVSAQRPTTVILLALMASTTNVMLLAILHTAGTQMP